MSILLCILRWLWSHFNTIAGVFLIPWGMFVVSLVLAGVKKVSETSASDVFIILSSLDLEFILFKDRFVNIVYAGIQSKFSTVFGVGLVGSFIFLALSSRVQRRISESHQSQDRDYPTGTLFFCWVFALIWMAVHFFAILGT
jgi:hypothetical protein